MPTRPVQMVKLSKFLSLILRHQPERFGLRLDEEGWASLREVLEILRGLPNFRWATRADVLELVEKGSGDGKRRFEVIGERIRARPPSRRVHPPGQNDSAETQRNAD